MKYILTMYWIAKSPIKTLVEFSRLVSEVNSTNEVLSLLVDAAVNIFKADGAAVFEINSDNSEINLVSCKQVPDSFLRFKSESGFIGPDLVKELLHLCQGKFIHAHPFPLVSNKDLYGSLILFFKEEATEETAIGEARIALIETLANLSAIALGKSDQYSKLEKTYRELQASQEILIRNEKLRALGEMSASISHDIGNLLTPLFLYVEILKKTTHENPKAISILEKFEKGLSLLLETSQRIKKFSKQTFEKNSVEIADLNALTKEAVDIVRPKMGLTISLKLELKEQLPQIPIQSSEFISAIVNILFNATEALTTKGEITVQTGMHEGHVWISISDNGPGMSQELKKKIFRPFFTTKGKKGTGLGLSMVAAFVAQHDGTITVDTKLGRGTTFILRFPINRTFH